jgi:hypothetical protein
MRSFYQESVLLLKEKKIVINLVTFPSAVVYFVVHKLRTMTPNSSDTRAHIALSVRFHLLHVIRHRRKQSRRRNSITEKQVGTQRSNLRLLLLRTNTSPSPIQTLSFFR